MFKLEDFEDSPILDKVDKLNKYLTKNKLSKVSNIIDDLERFLDQDSYEVQVTYILSVLAENNIDLISEELIQKTEVFLHSDDEKLKTNSLVIVGFAILAGSKYIDKYLKKFITFLTDPSEDIRNNILFFLIELVEKNPILTALFIEDLLESLIAESNDENILSMLRILEKCDDLNFDQLYNFRKVIKSIISSFQHVDKPIILTKAFSLLKKYFPHFLEFELDYQKIDILQQALDDQFIMKKHNFTEIKKKSRLKLKEYIDKNINTSLRDQKIYFYVKSKKDNIYIYELEKDKLLNTFKQDSKISGKMLLNTFTQVIETNSELHIFIRTLLKLKIIEGYYSDLGYYYPYSHIKSRFLDDFQLKGEVDLHKYNFLPSKFINKIIQEISKSTNQRFLRGREQKFYYSLKKIQKQINSEAAKSSVVDLKPNRAKLLDEDFIKLIKNLPKEYLSHFHKGTQWLTNLGTLKIKEEVNNSRIIGFFDTYKISTRLNIGQILLFDVFDYFVDSRSGIWDKNREIFYYSKYLTEKINDISTITDEEVKLKQIDKISKDLNIDKNHITLKIDENLQLVAEEIKQKDQIRITDYVNKTGMEISRFMTFVEDIGIPYFKKADLLIFNPRKIEEAKNDIKYMLIDKSKSEEFITLGTFEITSHLIEELIHDLLIDGKVKGIFHEEEGEVIFYTERGIRNLMLENSFLFSFNDLFYGKELTQEETNLLREVFDDLIKKRSIKGNFNEESLTFFSDEVLFAQDYNTVLFEFEKMVQKYIRKFEMEFQKIKRLLNKKDDTIFPQEIKIIQETIDKINENYVWWRSNLEAYINRANKKLLRDQGVSVKQYKTMFSKEKQDEIKSLAEDPEVYELQNNFKTWVSIFNKLEIKYPNVIYYQKRLIKNPNDTESKNNLDELLKETYLV